MSVSHGENRYQEILLQCYEDDKMCDTQSDYTNHDQDTEFEIELEDIDEGKEAEIPNPPSNRSYYYGLNRQKWTKISPYAKNMRTLDHNIVIKYLGIKNHTVHEEEPEKV